MSIRLNSSKQAQAPELKVEKENQVIKNSVITEIQLALKVMRDGGERRHIATLCSAFRTFYPSILACVDHNEKAPNVYPTQQAKAAPLVYIYYEFI